MRSFQLDKFRHLLVSEVNCSPHLLNVKYLRIPHVHFHVTGSTAFILDLMWNYYGKPRKETLFYADNLVYGTQTTLNEIAKLVHTDGKGLNNSRIA